MYQSAINQYKKINVQTTIVDADPHRLIQILLENILSELTSAKGHIQRNAFELRNRAINKSIGMIEGLKECLDFSQGEISERLSALYDYVQTLLFTANVKNNNNKLIEAIDLIITIKSGWDGIRESYLENVKN